MDEFYNILKESLNEEMGWMIDHIYEDYKDTDDLLGFALSCEFFECIKEIGDHL